mmetsp:Transcript_15602/g.38652  ORF Transcript_15602/g.38652 Transcript_15602/m.38652 type:complete len:222 (+) Transcript_15602:1678-2343(+)
MRMGTGSHSGCRLSPKGGSGRQASSTPTRAAAGRPRSRAKPSRRTTTNCSRKRVVTTRVCALTSTPPVRQERWASPQTRASPLPGPSSSKTDCRLSPNGISGRKTTPTPTRVAAGSNQRSRATPSRRCSKARIIWPWKWMNVARKVSEAETYRKWNVSTLGRTVRSLTTTPPVRLRRWTNPHLRVSPFPGSKRSRRRRMRMGRQNGCRMCPTESFSAAGKA